MRSSSFITETLLKISIIGPQKVGKTALSTHFCEKRFTREYRPTVAVDVAISKIALGK